MEYLEAWNSRFCIVVNNSTTVSNKPLCMLRVHGTLLLEVVSKGTCAKWACSGAPLHLGPSALHTSELSYCQGDSKAELKIFNWLWVKLLRCGIMHELYSTVPLLLYTFCTCVQQPVGLLVCITHTAVACLSGVIASLFMVACRQQCLISGLNGAACDSGSERLCSVSLIWSLLRNGGAPGRGGTAQLGLGVAIGS